LQLADRDAWPGMSLRALAAAAGNDPGGWWSRYGSGWWLPR